jgi:hypothetical protein
MMLSKGEDGCEKNKWREAKFSEHVASARWEMSAGFTVLDAGEACSVTVLRSLGEGMSVLPALPAGALPVEWLVL